MAFRDIYLRTVQRWLSAEDHQRIANLLNGCQAVCAALRVKAAR